MAKVPDIDNFTQAGEAAFQFAAAGVGDFALFAALQEAAAAAMETAPRRALRPKTVAHCASLMAAAGCAPNARYQEALLDAARSALARGGASASDAEVLAAVVDGEGRLSAFHPSALVLLWRWQKLLPKPDTAEASAPRAAAAVDFADSSLPLCVDLGCGLGSFVLGGAAADDDGARNWLGIDASAVAIDRARGAAARMGLAPRARFAVGDAADTLAAVASDYPGEVSLCCIHFPTPFRTAEDNRGGEASLDTQVHGGGAFMVQPALAEEVVAALAPGGGVALKSNSRDVLEAMRDEVLAAATRRGERLVSESWPAVPPLAGDRLAETDAASAAAGRDVHRAYLAKASRLGLH
eukprot:PRCOL_00005545-RA